MTTPRLTFASLATILLATLLLGCSSKTTPQSLIVVQWRSIQPTSLGSFGNPQARTPHWDRVARRGASFREKVGTDADLAFLTGGIDGPTLPELLRKSTVPSAAFTPKPTSKLWDQFDQIRNANTFGEAVDAATAWVRSLGGGSFFVTLRGEESEPPEALDASLGKLLRTLDEDGRLARTMIILSSEHVVGEREATRTSALALHGPRPFQGGGVHPEAVRRLDLFPTILYAFRHGPDYRLQGVPLQTVYDIRTL